MYFDPNQYYTKFKLSDADFNKLIKKINIEISNARKELSNLSYTETKLRERIEELEQTRNCIFKASGEIAKQQFDELVNTNQLEKFSK